MLCNSTVAVAAMPAHHLSSKQVKQFVLQLVELKSGETYNGHLVNCDSWMNIHLREVICTSKASHQHSSQLHNTSLCSAVSACLLLSTAEQNAAAARLSLGTAKHST
jgi:small nuclear ribonucleoprotein (snRNP)-like protein